MKKSWQWLISLIMLTAFIWSGSAIAAEIDGKAVYDKACATCHDSGIAGAPKIGDTAAWKDRIAKGMPTLLKHSINGFQGDAGMMPAKGGFSNLSDEEVEEAVEYMVKKSS